MEPKFEAVVIPVSDVDRAKAFYADTLGWRIDGDYPGASYGEAVGFRHPGADRYRVVQVTPTGSGCSVLFGQGVTNTAPGSYEGMHLVTSDIEAAQSDLAGRGVEVSGPFHFGPEGQTPGLEPSRADYGTYLSFRDPDGNTWLVRRSLIASPGDEAPHHWLVVVASLRGCPAA